MNQSNLHLRLTDWKLQRTSIHINYTIIELSQRAEFGGTDIIKMNLVRMQSREIKQLGKGSFSHVYLVLVGNMHCACKKIQLPLNSSLTYLLDEVNALRSIDHPNTIRCIGYSLESFTSFNIYLEYIKGRPLDEAYSIESNEELLLYWLFQLCLGLMHLEEKGIIHRDLKPKNILINERGVVKIVDFGIAKIACNSNSNIVGSLCYIAPEIITKNYVCHASDIWSLGVIFYELTHKRLPFDIPNNYSNSKQKVLKTICSADVMISHSFCSEELAIILEQMLKKNPQERITAKNILQCSAFRRRELKFAEQYKKSIH